jgi:hypothetical protein
MKQGQDKDIKVASAVMIDHMLDPMVFVLIPESMICLVVKLLKDVIG